MAELEGGLIDFDDDEIPPTLSLGAEEVGATVGMGKENYTPFPYPSSSSVHCAGGVVGGGEGGMSSNSEGDGHSSSRRGSGEKRKLPRNWGPSSSTPLSKRSPTSKMNPQDKAMNAASKRSQRLRQLVLSDDDDDE
mmetsp:Transcript_21098/g.54838  ORF Transcript_21098/g.54838 Transcript_21098/m.54838 type:complete len:136 (-) Transcript_21098:212-619(-)